MSDHASQLGAVAKRLEEAAGRLKARHVPADSTAPAPVHAPPPERGQARRTDDLAGALERLRGAGDDLRRVRARLAEIEARLRAA